MRVLFFTNLYPTPDEPWFGSFVAEQANAVRTLGVDVDVLAFDGRAHRSAYGRAAVRLRARLRGSSYHVVHAHYGLSGAVAVLQRRAPVVTTFWGSDLAIPWQRAVSRRVADLCTPIFVSRDGARSIGRPTATVIAPGIDLDRFTPLERTAARGRLGWSQTADVALFPGARGNPVKNVGLFDAGIAVARAELPHLEARSLEGYPRAVVPFVMAAADALVMTSISEGSPLVVKEALACGLPVVSVAVGDVAETIAGLPACAIVPRDPKAVAAAVCTAIRARADADILRERARRFDAQAVARRIESVYRTAAARLSASDR